MDEQRDSNDGNPQMRRRTVVAGLAVAGAAVGAGALAQNRKDGETQVATIEMPSLEPGTVLPGTKVRVIAVYPVTLGALPVVLETHAGERYQVDVLARDPGGPQGVGNTEHFSVYVSNRGDGGTSTDETEGLGAMALARVLEASENDLPSLLTLRARETEHPDGTFGVPLQS
ncbi:MAG: hypothetical protein ACRBN8_27475 [Nannocystales bacterium]